MEEPSDRSVALRDRKERLGLAELVVHCHREPALDIRAAPGGGNPLQLLAQRRVDVTRGYDLEPISLAFEARDRLPDLSNRAALQRERGRAHDRFVADLDRAESQGPHRRQQVVAGVEKRDSPAARVADALKLCEQLR